MRRPPALFYPCSLALPIVYYHLMFLYVSLLASLVIEGRLRPHHFNLHRQLSSVTPYSGTAKRRTASANCPCLRRWRLGWSQQKHDPHPGPEQCTAHSTNWTASAPWTSYQHCFLFIDWSTSYFILKLNFLNQHLDRSQIVWIWAMAHAVHQLLARHSAQNWHWWVHDGSHAMTRWRTSRLSG